MACSLNHTQSKIGTIPHIKKMFCGNLILVYILRGKRRFLLSYLLLLGVHVINWSLVQGNSFYWVGHCYICAWAFRPFCSLFRCFPDYRNKKKKVWSLGLRFYLWTFKPNRCETCLFLKQSTINYQLGSWSLQEAISIVEENTN